MKSVKFRSFTLPPALVMIPALFLAAGIGQVTASGSSSITGNVYCDHNQNGRVDDGEKGLENIHVQIFSGQCGGNALQTIHTDKEGNFRFRGFDPDTYFIRVDIPCVCGARMPTTSSCQQVDLKAAETVNLAPFGYSEYGR